MVEAYTTLVTPPDAEATVEGTEETTEGQVNDATISDTVEGLSDVSDSAE